MTDTPAEVVRYAIETAPNAKTGRNDYLGIVRHPIGEYVRYDAYRELERQLAEARANIERRPEDVVIPLALYDEINATGAQWKERAEAAESQLAAQRERDGRDAERYRWLCGRLRVKYEDGFWWTREMEEGVWSGAPIDINCLDAAIDAALKERT